MNETITWADANKELPDDSITVLILTVCRGVWCGYWDTGSEPPCWRHDSGGWATEVTHWAHMPEGPKVEE